VVAGSDPERVAAVDEFVGAALEPAPAIIKFVEDVLQDLHQAFELELLLNLELDVMPQFGWLVLV